MVNIKGSNKAKASDGAYLLIFLAWLLYTISYLGKVNYSANITQIVDYYQISKAEAGRPRPDKEVILKNLKI